MKKIVLGVLAALSVEFVSAAVYEIQLMVTTSSPSTAKLRSSANYCGEEGEIVYRKPGKMKIRAVVWGDACSCDGGAVVWNETTKVQYADATEFAWDFLNRIGSSGQEAEGLWSLNLCYASGDHAGYLYGAGTGKVKKPDQVSLSGNFAGYMYAGQVVNVTRSGKCLYCGETEVTVLEALAWGLCDCETVENSHTAAHGTWQMKYNSSASKAYEAKGDIAEAYRFPAYVNID